MESLPFCLYYLTPIAFRKSSIPESSSSIITDIFCAEITDIKDFI